MLQHKTVLSKREGDLNRREEGIAARNAELNASKVNLDDLERSRIKGEQA
jgi:hypothetical protein